MIRIILLLTPVYVSLFWFIALVKNWKIQSEPRRLMSVFMLFSAICLFSYFVYFAPFRDAFPYFEPLLAFSGSLIFPLFHIYFRLLTVDEKFSFKVHSKFLLIPALIPLVHIVGILLAPAHEYRIWLFNEHAFPDSSYVHFLEIMRNVLRITVLTFLVVSFILNLRLLSKYSRKAEHYYSDINDGKNNNAILLNYSLIITSIISFVGNILGRQFIIPKEMILYTIWAIISVDIYFIGYMANKLKPINPTFELETDTTVEMKDSQAVLSGQKKILTKLLQEFEGNKIYLKTNLNIMDVVQLVGTNRTYLSLIINQRYGQNFCNFVNSYRIKEMERVFSENSNYTYEILADRCGFGSVNSMKRAIQNQTGMSIKEWKQKQLKA
jgi:AraC-like DNA-binding protein